MHTYKQTWLKGFMWLALVFAWLLGLCDRPFSVPDEARYVEIPREMVVTGDWVTPRLNGVKYFEKPPLFYWIQACVQKMGASPVSEGCMRLPNLLIAVLGLIGTWLFARRFMGEELAEKATWMLATSALYYALSRVVILDMTVSVCAMFAFYAFYSSLKGSPQHQRWWMYAASVSAACGVLTKGIVVLALLGPVWLVWLTWERAWGQLRYIPSSILLFVAIVAPWHVLCGMRNPDFWYKYFWVEHVLRYITDMHCRYQPFWYFIPVLWAGLLPWSTAWSSRMGANLDPSLKRYLMLWAGWVFLFYSTSSSKIATYILPMMAPCILLFVDGLTVKRWGAIFWFILALVFLISPMFFYELYESKHALLPLVYLMTSVLLLMAFVLWFYPSWRTLSLSFLAFLWVVNKGTVDFQKPSIKPLVPYILDFQAKSGAKILGFCSYQQDLPLYTQQIITYAGYLTELEYGTQVEDVSAWIFLEDDIIKHLEQPFILVSRVQDAHAMPQDFTVVYKTRKFVVAMNKAALSNMKN